jgi:hypothetical protein
MAAARLPVLGCWCLAAGAWLLVLGCWCLAAGAWLPPNVRHQVIAISIYIETADIGTGTIEKRP